jgi:hypothetical protein
MSLKILFVELLTIHKAINIDINLNGLNNLDNDIEIIIFGQFDFDLYNFAKINLPINLKYILIFYNFSNTNLDDLKVPFGCKVLLNDPSQELKHIRACQRKYDLWLYYELNNEVKQYLINNKERDIENIYYKQKLPNQETISTYISDDYFIVANENTYYSTLL